MHTLEIEEKNKIINLPDHWDELTPDQLVFVFQKSLSVVDGTISYGQFCIEIFHYLTGLKINSSYVAKEKLHLNSRINESVYILASNLCGWAFYKTEKGYELNYNSFKNVFKTITIDGLDLYGPADLLSDITFREFRMAKDFMDYYYRSSKECDTEAAEIYLNNFISCLYRVGNNKKRIPLESDDLDIYSKNVANMEVWKKQWILIWYSYCINYIQTEHFEIEGAAVELEIIFPRSDEDDEATEKGLGWSGVLIDITKSQVFGTLDQCDNYPLFKILLYWYKTQLENLREKAKKL